VAIECRALIVDKNFHDVLGLDFGAGVQIISIDNFTLNLIIQAGQADSRTIVFTAPRITLPLPGKSSMAFPNSVAFDFNLREVPMRGFGIEFTTIRATTAEDKIPLSGGMITTPVSHFPYGTLIPPTGLPIEGIVPDKGTLLISGLQLKGAGDRFIILIVRPMRIIQQEIENHLLGPVYGKPTGI
jgi:hypothetical protein